MLRYIITVESLPKPEIETTCIKNQAQKFVLPFTSILCKVVNLMQTQQYNDHLDLLLE